MLIVTTNDIPGFEIKRVFGEVMGLTVRSRNAFSQIGAGFKSLMGGELKGMTKALYDSRNEVMQRLVGEAQQRGANAIIAMRFDTSEMGDVWTEICVYGTAVWAEPSSDEARQTAGQFGMTGAAGGGFGGAAQGWGGAPAPQQGFPGGPPAGYQAPPPTPFQG